MRVVVIGNGGREHALAHKIAESKNLDKLFIIPGNPGTSTIGENIQLDLSDYDYLVKFCKDEEIDLVVIGPEQPLVDGLADYLVERGISVFGPKANAAAIEGDKSFAKNLMKKYNVPTADYEIFDDIGSASEYISQSTFPIVIKASGLAAGKGVLICKNREEAEFALKDCFENNIFGESGKKVVIEEFLEGEEASVFAITDGSEFITLPPSQDHKRIFDGDKGKNTGGMGAYAPAPLITEPMMQKIEQTIISPMLKAMKAEGREYKGCLYAGLMITKTGPKVIEFNCRFGDPETQVVLPILKGDFLELLYSASKGKLNRTAVIHSGGSAVCVVAASMGYPDQYQKGYEIKGLDKFKNADNIIVYHAGTVLKNDQVLTNGGRVLGVTAICKDNNLHACKDIVYEAIENIRFKGIYYRKDIAAKAFKD